MAAQRGRSMHSKIIFSNLLPLFKEGDLHFQADHRKMGVKTENKKNVNVWWGKSKRMREEKS